MRRLPALLGLAALVTATLAPTPASAAVPVDTRVSAATTVGTHNAYERGTYTYLAQALDARPGLIELDVWPDVIARQWRVSHSNPLGNDNNCVAATSAAQLYTGIRNRNLEHCLDDIRLWLAAHPGAGPLILKLELKTGFSGRTGQGPAQLDAVLAARLGAAVFRPAELLAGHASLDAAARADAWPTRGQLAGRVIVELIPGTVEEDNPTDTLRTDVEYARYLAGLSAAGTLPRAQAFPAVHNAQTGDPRIRYAETALRPWFVLFDGDATAYVSGGIDTAWYDTNHYLLVMTDAQDVPPAVGADPDAAAARVAELARAHASVASADWSTLPGVVDDVLPRG
ncbi:phosphatidylinositol-specific phospholipase C domain-containing protein [Micromonospora sp. 4G57]|uniref:Phosphatidylinositol-specific phospholipase C domain-containing protein n=1 Tax=Micromonospora sicca TaxID=2202420 RepID=A0ABU5JD59_9ACTN|nr:MULTISPECIES: phosphatidylinositol-specific phospholipase C domain-containing protein [unclassified Micromonospora]MDZ5442056.1 phosphatidylinositol-specific phospholipase C domain-containing protein [Micromonospora sp. 4G57]MDZ5490517.1 phosphatidylinositol-specific phospholipase C domain-containing protein [Micromonospora sp. 4G53]